MIMIRRSLLYLVVSVWMTLSACTSARNGVVAFQHDTENKKINVTVNDHYFTSLIYSDTLEKPSLYPIKTPSGKFITRGYPLEPRPFERTDHPHHVGLWFNFGDVNGIDFWNNSSAIAPERKIHYGSVLLDTILLTDAAKGVLKIRSSWVNHKGERLLSEEATYLFSGIKNQYRFIERDTRLTAIQKITLRSNKEGLIALRVDGAFEAPDSKAAKRVDATGNVSDIPFVHDDANGLYRNQQGATGEAEVWGRKTPWVALRADKEGEIITIVILDHMQNPNYPGWPHARGYGLFSMNNLAGEAMDETSEPIQINLSPGESISFKHKVIIGGDMSDAEINHMMQQFNQPK